MRKFSELKSRPARAVQIYQILIGLAYNRQTITYGGLADILKFSGAGVFSQTLDHIAAWCAQNALPPLTNIVVNKDTGLPGSGLSIVTNLHVEREEVFGFDWYDLVPPVIQDFSEA